MYKSLHIFISITCFLFHGGKIEKKWSNVNENSVTNIVKKVKKKKHGA